MALNRNKLQDYCEEFHLNILIELHLSNTHAFKGKRPLQYVALQFIVPRNLEVCNDKHSNDLNPHITHSLLKVYFARSV